MRDTSERKMREIMPDIHAKPLSCMTNTAYDTYAAKADTKIEEMREKNNRLLANAKITLFH